MKRLLATSLALSMAFSTTAFAVPSATPSNATVDGSGTTEYIDLEIYDVVLPTSNILDFTLDPLGLLSVEDGENKDLTDLQGGLIVPSKAAPIINNSAVPVVVSVAINGTGDATFIPYDTDTEKTIASVEADDANNVLLYAVPSATNVVTEPDQNTAFAAAENGYVVTGTESTLKFVLDKAEYTITNSSGTWSADLKPGTGNGSAIQIGGYVNQKADWKEYSDQAESTQQEVGVHAVFSVAKATEADLGETPVEGIPGLVTTDVDFIKLTTTVGFAGEADPTVKNITPASIDGTKLAIPFNFGGKTIASIKTASGSNLISGTDYTFGANSITFSEAKTTAYKGLKVNTFNTITLDDNTTYRINFNGAAH